MSCNGCRVLRKGCSDTCILRPCLQWIDGPEAQGHATVFVAKFFGRAGLMNFISAVPENQRQALFRSLLYEACGRTVNPVFGAVGLLWSGNWQVNEAAVESVLKGHSLQPLITALKPAQNVGQENILNPAAVPAPMAAAAAAMLMLPHQQKQVPGDTKQQEMDIKPWTRSTKVKDEVLAGYNVSNAGLAAAKRELILAPVPRRVRPRGHAFGAGDQVVINGVDTGLDLDLTLGSHSPNLVKQQQHKQQQTSRVNSPCLSITSEGSVTSVSTGDDLSISLKQKST